MTPRNGQVRTGGRPLSVPAQMSGRLERLTRLHAVSVPAMHCAATHGRRAATSSKADSPPELDPRRDSTCPVG